MKTRKRKSLTLEQKARRRECARLRGDKTRETPERRRAYVQRRVQRLFGGDWGLYARAKREQEARRKDKAFNPRGTVDEIAKRAAMKQLITLLKQRARSLQPKRVLTDEEIEQRRLRAAERSRRKYASNAKYAIYHRVKRNIKKHLRDGTQSRNWSQRLGYSMDELHAHLERQFRDGMTWQNMGAWHIDHIVPVAAFTFTSVNDSAFRECYALHNLQPLWAAENMRKGPRAYYKKSLAYRASGSCPAYSGLRVPAGAMVGEI